MQVGVALGDDLADEDGVGLLGRRPFDELGHEDLRTEVDDPDLPVVLEALLASEALDVEDRIDPHGVGVRADARAHDDELAPEPAADREVDLLGGERRVLALDHVHRGHVDEVPDAAVDDEEGEVRPHRLRMHEHRRVHAHLRGELHCRPLGALVVRERQRERHLDHAVTRRVAVRPDDLRLRHGGLDGAHGPSRMSVAGL